MVDQVTNSKEQKNDNDCEIVVRTCCKKEKKNGTTNTGGRDKADREKKKQCLNTQAYF